MKRKEMKNKAGPLTGLVNLTIIRWIGKETKFKNQWAGPVRAGGRAREAGAKQLGCYWEGAGEGSPQAVRQTWESLASPASSLEAVCWRQSPWWEGQVPVPHLLGHGLGPTDENWGRAWGHKQLVVISHMHSKVLLEGTQLPLRFRHRDTTSNAEAIKMLLKDWVLWPKFWKLSNWINS